MTIALAELNRGAQQAAYARLKGAQAVLTDQGVSLGVGYSATRRIRSIPGRSVRTVRRYRCDEQHGAAVHNQNRQGPFELQSPAQAKLPATHRRKGRGVDGTLSQFVWVHGHFSMRGRCTRYAVTAL